MNHLESLVAEWFEFNGYFVRKNTKVGPLSHGGYEGELDIVAFHPETRNLIHAEPSIDALTWNKRELRFKKKFDAGKKHIPKLFPWLESDANIKQLAIIWGSDANHQFIGGGKVVPIKSFMAEVSARMRAMGKVEGNAIPESYPLLRTFQFAVLLG